VKISIISVLCVPFTASSRDFDFYWNTEHTDATDVHRLDFFIKTPSSVAVSIISVLCVLFTASPRDLAFNGTQNTQMLQTDTDENLISKNLPL
jgi:hypothetical protein